MSSDIIHSPRTKEELFNLRHASARNVIERIFGVLKRRFRILHLAPEYDLQVQAQIPAALCAVHNFIQTHSHGHHDSDDSDNDSGDDDEDRMASAANNAPAVASDVPDDDDAKLWRDEIAEAMWTAYQQVLERRGDRMELDGGASDDSEASNDGDTGL